MNCNRFNKIVIITACCASALGFAAPKSTQMTPITVAMPVRIASTSLAADEVLLALLRTPEERRRIIALSSSAKELRFSNISSEAKHLSSLNADDTEALVRAKPDLVILASYNRPAIAKQLREAHVHVETLGAFTSFTDLEDNIRQIGNWIGRQTEATGLIEEIRRTLADIQTGLPVGKGKLRVMTYFPDGTIFGMGTTVDSIITAAGGENVAISLHIKGWTKLSREQLLAARPDVILASGESSERAKLIADIQAQPLWRDLSAVRQGRLIVIPERELLALSQHVLKAVLKLKTELDTLAKDASAPQAKKP